MLLCSKQVMSCRGRQTKTRGRVVDDLFAGTVCGSTGHHFNLVLALQIVYMSSAVAVRQLHLWLYSVKEGCMIRDLIIKLTVYGTRR